MSKTNQKTKAHLIDLAIIGGGPAGLAAAISSAKLSRVNNKNLKINIFESENKLGKTILKTGNGRCNFSNYFIEENKGNLYNNKKFVNKVIDSCEQTTKNKIYILDNNVEEISAPLRMFEDLGLSCYYDDEGRLFPYTNKASSVVDVLRYEVEDLQIKTKCNQKLKSINFNEKYKTFEIVFVSGEKISAKKVIVSSGILNFDNKSIKKSLIPYKYVLGPIKTDTKFINNLDGVKAHVKCTIFDGNKEQSFEIGEVLFRKYGLSGICIFNLSRFLNNSKQKIKIDFAPEDELKDLVNLVKKRHKKIKRNNEKNINFERLFAGMVLPNIIKSVCNYTKVKENEVNTQNIEKICFALKHFDVEVLGIADEKQCQVKRGGIDTISLNASTLEYKFIPGLYFAGEIVDVDGPCGGYNLYWA